MSTETLTTEGENSQVADTQQQPSTLITEGQQANGDGVEATQAQGTGDEAGGDQGKPVEGAPESYAEFAAPEGLAYDKAVIEQFTSVAKELNLPQDKAQLVLDKMAPVIAQRQAEQVAAVQAEWAEQTRADKEIGGDRLPETLSIAKKALEATGTPELRHLLDQSGFGNHPAVIRHFYQVGKAISQDSVVTSGDGVSSGSAGRPAADVLYDKTSSSK